jgi:hypothetical protein
MSLTLTSDERVRGIPDTGRQAGHHGRVDREQVDDLTPAFARLRLRGGHVVRLDGGHVGCAKDLLEQLDVSFVRGSPARLTRDEMAILTGMCSR